MKIAIFSDTFYPELSGITDSLVVLSDALAERGHEILFVVPRYTKKNYLTSNVDVGERKSHKNISVKRIFSFKNINYPTSQGRVAIPSFSGFWSVKKFQPDIIYANSPFGAGLQALIDAKLLGVPIIGTNHTPPSEFMAYSPINTKWFAKLTNYYFAWYYNRTCFMSAPCQSLIDEMISFGFNQKNKVIPNPTNLELFNPVANQEEKEISKKRFNLSDYTVLYTGRLAEEKNVDVIIKAIALAQKFIPDISFAITGHGAAEEKLRQLAFKLGLKKSVIFLGYVDKEVFPLLYKASDIFVIMSTAESQSLSLMQAMASGLPVVGAKARALPEYITDDCGFIVPVGDFEKLSQVLLNIFRDKNLRTKLEKGSLERVSHFSTNIITTEWEKIYQKTIEGNHKKYE